MNIYNNKRPEDSKLSSTEPQRHIRLYFRFIKHTSVDFNEIYKKLVEEDINNVEFMRTSPDAAWAREGDYILPEQEFFYGIENELLFYESILEAISNYISSDIIMVRDGAYGTQYYLVQNYGQEDESWTQLNSLDPNDVYQDQHGNIDVITNPEFISALNDPRNGYRRVFVGGKKRGKKSIKNKKRKTKKRKTRRRKTRKH